MQIMVKRRYGKPNNPAGLMWVQPPKKAAVIVDNEIVFSGSLTVAQAFLLGFELGRALEYADTTGLELVDLEEAAGKPLPYTSQAFVAIKPTEETNDE